MVRAREQGNSGEHDWEGEGGAAGGSGTVSEKFSGDMFICTIFIFTICCICSRDIFDTNSVAYFSSVRRANKSSKRMRRASTRGERGRGAATRAAVRLKGRPHLQG